MRLDPSQLLLLIRILPFALIGAGLLLLNTAPRPSASPVYSVSALQADLTEAPGAWDGRVVQVRAVVGSRCVAWLGGPNPVCASSQPTLLDVTVPNTDTALPLQLTAQSPYLAALRRLPRLGQLVPAPQSLQWDHPAVYHVQLHAEDHGPCISAPCGEALLLDATS